MQKLLFTFLAVFSIVFAAKAHQGYHVGETIADFSLKNINDKNVSLSDYKDAKGFIIIFTCNHCPFAKAYEDRIEALNKKYAPLGYPVIAISPNDADQYPEDGFPEMKIRAKEKGFTFPYLYDEKQSVAKTFGAMRTPHVFVGQKEAGKIVAKYIGAIDDNWENPSEVKEKYTEQAVDALLAGKSVAVQYTKAIGCTIKWKK